MNLIGVRTLLEKEVRRFMKVPGQTIFSPLISTSLYFLVFGFTLGGRQADFSGVPYIVFIVPGLVFLGTANNAFLNSSSSVFITKLQGTVVDLLVAPLGPVELMIGFVSGAMVRGLMVGIARSGFEKRTLLASSVGSAWGGPFFAAANEGIESAPAIAASTLCFLAALGRGSAPPQAAATTTKATGIGKKRRMDATYRVFPRFAPRKAQDIAITWGEKTSCTHIARC